MDEVEFSEERAYTADIQKALEMAPKKGFAQLPIKLGLAKDETGANIILIGVAVFTLLLGTIIFLLAL
ncbi:MAG: hypothetical protein EXS51_03845 [Candidatus Taylorbacteria bacterium]|nr:hypothetical protein [Candidatus Taylorbacteria bacterium]